MIFEENYVFWACFTSETAWYMLFQSEVPLWNQNQSHKNTMRTHFCYKSLIFEPKSWFSCKSASFRLWPHCFAQFATENFKYIFWVKSLKVSKSNLETFLVCMFGCLRPPEGATSKNSFFNAKMVKILKMVPSSHLKFRIFAVATSIDTGTPNNLSNVFLRQFRNFWISHQKNIFEILSRKVVQCEGAKNKEIMKKHIFAPSTFCTSRIVGKWLVESFQI